MLGLSLLLPEKNKGHEVKLMGKEGLKFNVAWSKCILSKASPCSPECFSEGPPRGLCTTGQSCLFVLNQRDACLCSSVQQ